MVDAVTPLRCGGADVVEQPAQGLHAWGRLEAATSGRNWSGFCRKPYVGTIPEEPLAVAIYSSRPASRTRAQALKGRGERWLVPGGVNLKLSGSRGKSSVGGHRRMT
jgi:hypothetical protein